MSVCGLLQSQRFQIHCAAPQHRPHVHPNEAFPELAQGCLRPVEIKIPENSILWPSPEAAVVGGNVLTSQRVTDVILKCFEAAAASQVCTGLRRTVAAVINMLAS